MDDTQKKISCVGGSKKVEERKEECLRQGKGRSKIGKVK